MNDKVREQFEAWAIARGQSVLRQGAGYAAERTGMAWLCWQASREAVVVELPRDIDQFADDDHGRRAFSLHTNTAYRECRRAITAQGLKVKP